jgi:hypothetical protein
VGNPGNDKPVGRSGEKPNGKDGWGGGSKGRSDGKGKGPDHGTKGVSESAPSEPSYGGGIGSGPDNTNAR